METFHARVWQEGEFFVAQCVEVDIASHGFSDAEALANLREALELYFEEPVGAIPPLHEIQISKSAA